LRHTRWRRTWAPQSPSLQPLSASSSSFARTDSQDLTRRHSITAATKAPGLFWVRRNFSGPQQAGIDRQTGEKRARSCSSLTGAHAVLQVFAPSPEKDRHGGKPCQPSHAARCLPLPVQPRSRP
jgi:hypothetical protein